MTQDWKCPLCGEGYGFGICPPGFGICSSGSGVHAKPAGPKTKEELAREWCIQWYEIPQGHERRILGHDDVTGTHWAFCAGYDSGVKACIDVLEALDTEKDSWRLGRFLRGRFGVK